MADDDRSFTTTVTIGEEKHEVSVSVPDGFIRQSAVDEDYVLKDTVQDRIKRGLKGRHRFEDITADEDLLRRIATERGDWFREELKIEGEKPDLTKFEESLRLTHVKPLEDERDLLKTENGRLRTVQLNGAVSSASLALTVKKSQVDLLGPYYAARTRWSEEDRDWYLVDDKGEFEYSQAKPGTYKTIREDMDQKSHDPVFADWFDGKGRRGSDYKGGGPPGRDGEITAEAFGKMTDGQRKELYHSDRERYVELMTGIRTAAETELAKKE